MYSELATSHPIDLCRYQVANGYMGRVGLINSGGESHGESDLRDAVVTAVINKHYSGSGFDNIFFFFHLLRSVGVLLMIQAKHKFD